MNDPASTWSPPRELVLASAGSGKTHYLSTQLIALLARGVPVEEILASTFTRKAAGEIQERVLLRLAEAASDDAAANALAEATAIGESGARAGSDPWLALLGTLLPELHRLRVGTLDAFLVRIAFCFANELGLPPGWSIADEAAVDRMRAETLDDILDRADRGMLVELLRAAHRGEAMRDVHGRLASQVDGLQGVLRQAVDGARAIWAPPLELPELDSRKAEQRRLDLARRLSDLPPPPDRTGTNPNPRWEKPLFDTAEAIRTGDWKAFAGSELVRRTLEDEFPYHKSSPTPEITEALNQAIEMARAALGAAIKRQAASLGRLAMLHDEAHEHRVRTVGSMRFDDVTHRVAAMGSGDLLDSVFFRLDSNLRHLLLDEFQDTSLNQWEALMPFAQRTLQEGEGARAAVIVADPKQSIYGWRNARPQLASGIGAQFGMRRRELDRSYRSSPILVDTVGTILEGLPKNKIALEMNQEGDGLETWMQGVTPLRAHRELPGHVSMQVGPGGESGNVRPLMLDFAADRIGALHRELPGAQIGVLVRTNPAVAYLVGLLRGRGVDASGEGGTPLTDTGPVNAILALLRIADHPGDTLARYHVARSPLGTHLGYLDPAMDSEARAISLRIREELLRVGYGRTLASWAAAMDPTLSPRERGRMGQLVEEGYRWDDRASLRPADFVARIERTRREESSEASVRVMTVHQSKGLEFDVVVLPDLGQTLVKETRSGLIKVRDEVGRIRHVYPEMDAATRRLFPEVRQAYQADRETRVLDALSVLYVALTRPRYALHLLVPADGKSISTARSGANLLREALAPGTRAELGETLFEAGDPDWAERLDEERRSRLHAPHLPWRREQRPVEPVVLRPFHGRQRNLPRSTPSGLEGGRQPDLARILDVRGAPGMQFGTLIHAWCEAVEWLDGGEPGGGLPGEAELVRIAREVAPEMDPDRIATAVRTFRDSLGPRGIHEVFQRPDPGVAGQGETRTVERELPFAIPLDGEILRGTIDRLILDWKGPRATRAWVVDFKSDRITPEDGDSMEDRVEFYRPQLEAYGRAVEALYDLPPAEIRLSLAFLSAGRRIDLREFGNA